MSFTDLAQLEKALSEHTNMNINEYAMLNKRMDDVIKALEANTAGSAEMLLLYDNLKTGFKILRWIEVASTFFIRIGKACLLAWIVWKYGVLAVMESIKK